VKAVNSVVDVARFLRITQEKSAANRKYADERSSNIITSITDTSPFADGEILVRRLADFCCSKRQPTQAIFKKRKNYTAGSSRSKKAI